MRSWFLRNGLLLFWVGPQMGRVRDGAPVAARLEPRRQLTGLWKERRNGWKTVMSLDTYLEIKMLLDQSQFLCLCSGGLANAWVTHSWAQLCVPTYPILGASNRCAARAVRWASHQAGLGLIPAP